MSKRILALDVGASTVKLAEFQLHHDHSIELLNYGVKPLGIGPEDEANRLVYTGTAITELLSELRIKPGPVLMSVSGQHVFSRYVKLPPVSADKIQQIVTHEARQNVPYPLDEVVWDRQILPADDDQFDVLLAAIKLDILEQLSETVTETGLETELVDVSVAAILNAVRHNYGESDECTLVIDMGARTTNLIFVEGQKVFSRSIPVSGNTISQQIAKDFEVSFIEAEEMKESVSMVALAGAFEPLEDANADRVTKCIRGVMTRMHADISRSVNHYRGQQKGNAPTRVLLTGGSCVMDYLDRFLEEKLNVPVEYLNPVQNVGVSMSISEEQIAGDLHLLSEVVGLGLRRAGECPIELNLLPPSITRERTFRKKQGFLVASMFMVAGMVGVWAWGANLNAAAAAERKAQLESEVNGLDGWARKIAGIDKQVAAQDDKMAAVGLMIEDRSTWMDLLEEVKGLMPEGVWISQVRIDQEKKDTLSIVGAFFQDDVYENVKRPDNSTFLQFRDALRASAWFKDAEGTKFEKLPRPLAAATSEGVGRYVSAFEIEAVLEESLPQ